MGSSGPITKNLNAIGVTVGNLNENVRLKHRWVG